MSNHDVSRWMDDLTSRWSHPRMKCPVHLHKHTSTHSLCVCLCVCVSEQGISPTRSALPGITREVSVARNAYKSVKVAKNSSIPKRIRKYFLGPVSSGYAVFFYFEFVFDEVRLYNYIISKQEWKMPYSRYLFC